MHKETNLSVILDDPSKSSDNSNFDAQFYVVDGVANYDFNI